MKNYSSILGFASAVLIGTLGFAPNAMAGSIPAGWICSGNCGSLGADGVVPLSPIGNSSYQFVSTAGGTVGVGALPTGGLGGETNGSTLATSVFSATADTDLNFYFDYVTADGAGWADYSWAELFDSSNTPVALLFTARTMPSGSIVPGQGMPAPAVTLNPSSVPIQIGTTWSPLGNVYGSGYCYAVGCGNSEWVNANYTIANAGDYYLEIGVTNWGDQNVQSGLAMDGVTVGGQPISTTTPEPSTLFMMASGLGALAGGLKRKLFA